MNHEVGEIEFLVGALIFLAEFLILKKYIRFMRSPYISRMCVCLSVYHPNNVCPPVAIFMKLGMYFIPPEVISTT
jgi:hypothetical protein